MNKKDQAQYRRCASKKYPTKRMDKVNFLKAVESGKIMIGGLGNPDGVRITKTTKNRIWYK